MAIPSWRAVCVTAPEPTTESGHRFRGGMVGLGIVVVLTLVGIDQLLKYVMVEWLGPNATSHRWELAGKYLAFQYVENRGAAFGILAGRTMLLTILAVVVAIGFVVAIRQDLTRNRALRIAILLILAGAIGNLTDRLRLGYVIDFMAVGVWPKFNLADACISIALAILAWTSFFSKPREAHLSPQSKEKQFD